MSATTPPLPKTPPPRRPPRLRQFRGVSILAPVGVLDEDLLRLLGQQVASEAPRPVVLDLSGCVVTCVQPEVWSEVCSLGTTCVVCARLSGRRILSRATTGRCPVFHDVDVALALWPPAALDATKG